ncbi:hypothetical protein F511_22007 [Dorcoceras hygrometricum]|uniref:Uncharacterized protein n=1 Tax=Dorcoceras hygrometricum TaxID=472368 RepID=A0A2Z7C938_9LAMI|nr:hypothetical protein F511_22007 [Dorcoceras hygrometricum]
MFMYDQNPSPASSSSPSAAVGRSCHNHRGRRHMVEEEEEEGDLVACSGDSCQSCTARVIADCVALCCCPCAVVNLMTLAFLKLPWAVARRCIRRRKKEKMREIRDKEMRRCGGGDINGISRKERGNECTSGFVWEEGGGMDNLGAEEIWLELYEVGHLAFGRVSFSGNILNR